MTRHLKEYKTRVYKNAEVWNVVYYWPYSGLMLAWFDTWQEAMNEACGIEKNRGWE